MTARTTIGDRAGLRTLLGAVLLGVALLALVACTDDSEGNGDAAPAETTSTSEATSTPDATTTAEATATTETTAPEETTATELTITGVWARGTAGNPDENSAIYAAITNHSAEDDTLVSASVSEEIAERVELHEVVQEGDSMVMREIEGGIPVPASGVAMLEPGGLHVMLLNVQEQLQPGQTFTVTFTFEHAGDVELEVEVREASSMGGGSMGGSSMGGSSTGMGGN